MRSQVGANVDHLRQFNLCTEIKERQVDLCTTKPTITATSGQSLAEPIDNDSDFLANPPRHTSTPQCGRTQSTR
jgi:hypothetical protein